MLKGRTENNRKKYRNPFSVQHPVWSQGGFVGFFRMIWNFLKIHSLLHRTHTRTGLKAPMGNDGRSRLISEGSPVADSLTTFERTLMSHLP